MPTDPLKRQDEMFRKHYDEMLVCDCGFRSERSGSWRFNPRQGYLQCPRCGNIPRKVVSNSREAAKDDV